MCGIVVVPMSTIGCAIRRRGRLEQALVRARARRPDASGRRRARRRVRRMRAAGARRPARPTLPGTRLRESSRRPSSSSGSGGSRPRDVTRPPRDRRDAALVTAGGVRSAHGCRRDRAPRARLPAREAADDARPVPAHPQRASAGVQPDDESRPDRQLRRAGDPRGAATSRPTRLDTRRERAGEPGGEVPAAVRPGARARARRDRSALRPDAPRRRRRQASSSSERSGSTASTTSATSSRRSTR